MKRVKVFFNILVSNEMTQEKLESLLLQAVERVGKIVVMKVEAVEKPNLPDGEGG